jgi:hypothetical protein
MLVCSKDVDVSPAPGGRPKGKQNRRMAWRQDVLSVDELKDFCSRVSCVDVGMDEIKYLQSDGFKPFVGEVAAIISDKPFGVMTTRPVQKKKPASKKSKAKGKKAKPSKKQQVFSL